jgi:hypothetical protein
LNVTRTATAAVADRIRIEDEVWDDAFASRVRSRPKRAGVPKTRLDPSWFVDAEDQPRPYGVDPPASGARDMLSPVPPSDPGESADPLSGSPPARRTIRIQGRGAERNLPVTRPEGYAPAASRSRASLLDPGNGFEPDRVAMWAMLLGVALLAVAILSSSL